MVQAILKYTIYSTMDLKSAYDQVQLREEDEHFIMFEVKGQLYQFKWMPFKITNGVAGFQRIMDEI